MPIETRQLGRGGPIVSAIGLGCMGMSGTYGVADEKESIATVHAALESGVTMLDTADFYGMGHNELLLQKALAGRPRESYFPRGQVRRDALPAGQFCRHRRAPGRGQKFPRLHAQALGHRSRRSLPGRARRSQCSHRRYDRRDRRNGESGIRSPCRHLRSVLRDDSAALTRSIRSRLCKSNTRSSRAPVEADIIPTLREFGISLVAYGVFSRGLLTGHAPNPA